MDRAGWSTGWVWEVNKRDEIDSWVWQKEGRSTEGKNSFISHFLIQL